MNKKTFFFKTSFFVVFALAMFVMPSVCQADQDPTKLAKEIPIQHKGRIKSLDAFSHQTLRLITGKSRWEKEAPHATLLGALANRERMLSKEWLRLDYPELKETLGLDLERKYFSYNEISPSLMKLVGLVRSAKEKRDSDNRPSKLEQKAEILYRQMMTVQSLYSGESVIVIPTETGIWQSPFIHENAKKTDFASILTAFEAKDWNRFEQETSQWIASVKTISVEARNARIAQEIFYYNAKPFQISWIAYLAAFLFLAFLKKYRAGLILGLAFLGLALATHTLGLGLRVWILSRPPVSNMYESMVFMNWALVLFAIVFSSIRRNTVPLMVASLVSSIIMIYGNLLPIDPAMDVLVPVLRSNYWLTIHVLTVVSSYGAFALAMALGHRHLLLDIFQKLNQEAENASSRLILRIIEVGVILIGIGTVLGGVWANESWGRFWGWDPKETWALITLLGYLILVHLRYLKRLSAFGLALSSILGFQLVLMTWYGVNFVLGRGLHSYGAGSGGMNWILYYLAAEGLFIAFVLFKKVRVKAYKI